MPRSKTSRPKEPKPEPPPEPEEHLPSISKRVDLPLSLVVEDPSTLVLLLRADELAVYHLACEALGTFAQRSSANRMLIRDQKGLPHVVQKISTAESTLILRSSSYLLAVCLGEEDIRLELWKLGGVSALLELLLSDDHEIIENTTLCLAHLSADAAIAAEIVRLSGMEPLVQLLKANVPAVQANTILALANAAAEYTSRVRIRQLEALPTIIVLLQSPVPEVAQTAALCLSRCTQEFESRKEIRKAGGFEVLIQILEDADKASLHMDCADVLANCLAERHGQTTLRDIGGLGKLIDVIQVTEVMEVMQPLTLALARACDDAKNRDHFCELEGLGMLVPLLRIPDGVVVKNVAHLLYNCIDNVDLCKRICSEDVLPVLITLIGDDAEQGVQSMCLVCLARLAQLFENRAAIREVEGMQHILPLLQHENEDMRHNAAECLANMAQEHESRVVLRLLDCVSIILSALSADNNDNRNQAALCRLIAAIAHDSEICAELSKQGGLQMLLALLEDEDPEVRRNAEWALSVCADDRGTSAVICDIGGVDRLQGLAEGPAAKDSTRAKDTLTKLLKHNLPGQYCLEGRLNEDDIIEPGFYDMGRAKAFPTLEELRKRKINNKREVLLVDPSTDSALEAHVKFAVEKLKPLPDLRAMAIALAEYVSAAMGGSHNPATYNEFGGYEYDINMLKVKLQTNVIPLGMITQGVFYHRALLFKYLGDCIDLPSALVRGDYTRCWNAVLGDGDGEGELPYVVDLMHNVGNLILDETDEARAYQRI